MTKEIVDGLDKAARDFCLKEAKWGQNEAQAENAFFPGDLVYLHCSQANKFDVS